MCLKFTFSQSSRKVDPLRAVWNWGVTQIYHALLCFFPILFSDIACIFPRNVYQSQQQTSDQITLCRVPSSKPPSVPANVLYCHLILGSLFCHAPPAPRVLLRPQGGDLGPPVLFPWKEWTVCEKWEEPQRSAAYFEFLKTESFVNISCINPKVSEKVSGWSRWTPPQINIPPGTWLRPPKWCPPPIFFTDRRRKKWVFLQLEPYFCAPLHAICYAPDKTFGILFLHPLLW